ncbi:hypothetical protein GDO86_017392 [Hymenochirus boettgeri]|uniref:Otoancorin n=1 Tax=Hymenochirus boettgeri TaxID=247094 RepID=A0A8T2IQA4_9PIPI|nr:hypothetical protein GDO86_017392 [Hymenochirus boettgeri]
MALVNYLEKICDNPKFLLHELQQLDATQFHLAMKYLLGAKKETFDMADIVVDFETIRERIFQRPGGNRTLFLATLEKCLPVLKLPECVDLVSQVLRMYGAKYLQADVIRRFPAELPDYPFRNMSSVFRDFYDKISANTRRALYEWMTLILQEIHMANDANGSTSWITAENLWILGRYVVHLPIKEIRKININEVSVHYFYSLTINIPNAMLGLLVCFYGDAAHLDPTVAKALLHQMIKCNQLKGYHSDVQKLKSQFLQIAMLNQTLNESLGSLSDAVVGLTLPELESLSPEAVHGALLTLQQVSGWTKSQIMVLTSKYLHSEKVLTFSNISQLGELVSGIGAQSLYEMNSREILMLFKSGLSQHASDLSPAQREAILSKVLSSGDFQTTVLDMNGVFFKEVSLSYLLTQGEIDASVLKNKEMRKSQLVKGIPCEQIESMSKPTFLNHYKLLEKNIQLLTPYQIHCLAWKYWKVSQSTIPAFLLVALPSEYIASNSGPCETFLFSLGMSDLHYSTKKEIIINKVDQCLNGSLADVYQLDMIGSLICHLSPKIIKTGISTNIIASAINLLKLCPNLSQDQKRVIKTRLLEYYGNTSNWTSETVQDMAPFWNLLSKNEFQEILKKFQNTVLQMVSDTPGIPLSGGMLSVFFDAVRFLCVNVSVADQTAGAMSPSADDITRLTEANSLWSCEELQHINIDTFTKTVDILGNVRSFNQSQLSILKEKAKQVWGGLSLWKSYHIITLGRIVTALNENEIEELDLNSIDAVSALTQQTEWTSKQAKAILHGFLNDSAMSFSDLKSYHLAGLARSLCAADTEQIDQIQTSEFRAVISRIGSLPCELNILQAFKKKALMVYGKPDQWSHFIINDIGYIAAGLTKEEFKSLDAGLMAYIQPAVITYIPDETFKELSPEQIAYLGSENGAMVTGSQRALLNTTQLHSLDLALDGISAIIPVTESLTSVTTTKNTSPLASRSM